MRLDLLNDVVTAMKNREQHIVFDMSCWARTNCETAGCAIGCYCLANPDIPLKLIPKEKPPNSAYPDTTFYDINYGLYNGFLAIKRYFEITYEQAEYLFYDMMNKMTEGEVIARLELFILSNMPKDMT